MVNWISPKHSESHGEHCCFCYVALKHSETTGDIAVSSMSSQNIAKTIGDFTFISAMLSQNIVKTIGNIAVFAMLPQSIAETIGKC